MQYNTQLPYKKPVTLSKLLVVILLLCTFMTVFLQVFFSHEESIEQAGLQTIVANFTGKVFLVKSQWLMTSKPNVVVVQVEEKGKKIKQEITVNIWGWIDSDSRKNVCEDIWLTVMERPLAFFNMPIGAALINKRDEEKSTNTVGSHCRYTVKTGEYFEYHSGTGAISKILQ